VQEIKKPGVGWRDSIKDDPSFFELSIDYGNLDELIDTIATKMGKADFEMIVKRMCKEEDVQKMDKLEDRADFMMWRMQNGPDWKEAQNACFMHGGKKKCIAYIVAQMQKENARSIGSDAGTQETATTASVPA